jgi:hypothetical protein
MSIEIKALRGTLYDSFLIKVEKLIGSKGIDDQKEMLIIAKA